MVVQKVPGKVSPAKGLPRIPVIKPKKPVQLPKIPKKPETLPAQFTFDEPAGVRCCCCRLSVGNKDKFQTCPGCGELRCWNCSNKGCSCKVKVSFKDVGSEDVPVAINGKVFGTIVHSTREFKPNDKHIKFVKENSRVTCVLGPQLLLSYNLARAKWECQ